MPTRKFRARLSSMADATGVAVIAVDPAYTSRWGAQHWQKPLASTTRKTTRHDVAVVAIGRRAQGHPIRRRTAPPPAHRSDEQGHWTAQAGRRVPAREGTRPRMPGPRTRSVGPGYGANAGNQNAQHRSGRSAEHESWQQDFSRSVSRNGRGDAGYPLRAAPRPCVPERTAAAPAGFGHGTPMAP